MTKSTANCGFGHNYWRNSCWKISFFVQGIFCLQRIFQSQKKWVTLTLFTFLKPFFGKLKVILIFFKACEQLTKKNYYLILFDIETVINSIMSSLCLLFISNPEWANYNEKLVHSNMGVQIMNISNISEAYAAHCQKYDIFAKNI